MKSSNIIPSDSYEIEKLYQDKPSFLLSYENPHFKLLFPCDLQLNFLINYLHCLTDIISFAKVSKSHYSLFRNHAPKILLCPLLLPQLLKHVARGEYDTAKEIYSKNPTVLTAKGKISHPHRFCYINQTNFQIALRNAEYKEAEKMEKHLTPEERQKQFNEIFPDGKIISYGCQFETAKALLKNVYDAIIVDDVIHTNNFDLMTDRTREALKALYDAVNPENYNKSQIGLVFDVRIYLEALSIYNANFNTFGTWNRRSFWCMLEDLIVSCLPTVYLRARPNIGTMVHANVVNWDKLDAQGCLLADGSSYFDHYPIQFSDNRISLNYHGHLRLRVAGVDTESLSNFTSLYQAITSAGSEFMDKYFQANTDKIEIRNIR